MRCPPQAFCCDAETAAFDEPATGGASSEGGAASFRPPLPASVAPAAQKRAGPRFYAGPVDVLPPSAEALAAQAAHLQQQLGSPSRTRAGRSGGPSFVSSQQQGHHAGGSHQIAVLHAPLPPAQRQRYKPLPTSQQQEHHHHQAQQQQQQPAVAVPPQPHVSTHQHRVNAAAATAAAVAAAGPAPPLYHHHFYHQQPGHVVPGMVGAAHEDAMEVDCALAAEPPQPAEVSTHFLDCPRRPRTQCRKRLRGNVLEAVGLLLEGAPPQQPSPSTSGLSAEVGSHQQHQHAHPLHHYQHNHHHHQQHQPAAATMAAPAQQQQMAADPGRRAANLVAQGGCSSSLSASLQGIGPGPFQGAAADALQRMLLAAGSGRCRDMGPAEPMLLAGEALQTMSNGSSASGISMTASMHSTDTLKGRPVSPSSPLSDGMF